eukprot:CAMPEP_0198727868 /NCGR_PEP_ID=MMETSP1475-20131203/5956_1 /TAXON_ID= ORGANISM="Unidentified sp., Strain CCMP1999" /NCGR_SAMPLE_ID=MMETSP1475 /ASSEMBLY_ACC=CAM_ASM_001111 /LENGTH=199 /DNA_ID=CAMNT_0044490059 /DNA_START=55 /DNA_END=654 /DNA_ORIENTATION=-
MNVRAGSRFARSLLSASAGAGVHMRGGASAGMRLGSGLMRQPELADFSRRQLLAAGGVRWKAVASPHETKEDEEEEENLKKPDYSKPTSGHISFDLKGQTFEPAAMRTLPIFPHLTHMKAEFHTMLSISSRIGAVVLTMMLLFNSPAASMLLVEYAPVGHLKALMFFGFFSSVAHTLVLFQHQHLRLTKWGDKSDSWEK